MTLILKKLYSNSLLYLALKSFSSNSFVKNLGVGKRIIKYWRGKIMPHERISQPSC